MIIQRWQNLLLFIAAVLMCVFCLTPFASIPVEGEEGVAQVYTAEVPVFLVVNLVVVVLLVIALACFKNLKKQRTLTAIAIFLLVASLVSAIVMVNCSMPEASLIWLGGMTLVVLTIVCCIAAYVFMGKDRQRLRSYDRLR